MANLSTAFGTVTITAKDPNILAQFLSLHLKSEEHADYGTTLNVNGLDIKEVQLKSNQDSMTSISRGGMI